MQVDFKKIKTSKKRLNLTMSNELFYELEKYCKEHEVKKTRLIREIISEYLKKQQMLRR